MIWRLKQRKRLLFLLSSGGLIAYLAVIIYSNYNFQSRLATSLHQQFTMQTQVAAEALRAYFDAREFEMDDLLASRELIAYSENKALGMSEKYGLKQSLALVHARLLTVMDRKHPTGGTLYQRITLYDADGAVLTDAAPESSPSEHSQDSFSSKSLGGADSPRIQCDGNEVLLVTPWRLKERIIGAIVARLNPATVLALAEGQMRTSGMEWRLVADAPGGGQVPFGSNHNPPEAGGVTFMPGSTPQAGGDSSEWRSRLAGYPTALARFPIPNTPFVLNSMIPSGEVFGWNFPTASTSGLTALAVVVLLGLLWFLRVNEEMVAVTVRLWETEKSSLQISEKNVRLHEEIEHRKEAEQQLAASERLLTSVITGAQVGIWDWNVQTGEIHVNERWAEMLGFQLQDLEPITAATWERLCHPEDFIRARSLLGRLFEGRVKHYESEIRMRHAQGHWIWVLDRGMVVEWDENGKPLRASGTHADTSERKRAEEERIESEQRLQAILHAMPDSVVLVDRDHVILWANQMCFDVYGSTVLGRKSWEACLNLDSACNVQFSHEEEGKQAVYEQELEWKDPSGTTRSVLHMAAVVSWDREGVPERLIEIFRDITEHKRLEDQLRQTQKMEAIGQLTGGVAHDLNNILQAVTGYTELALLEVPEESPAKDILSDVIDAGQRGARPVSQLLSFSRRQVMKLADMDLRAVTEDVIAMLACIIGEKVHLEFLPAPGLWNIRADRGMMEQVLMNLCINARDAMPEGGTITIQCANTLIEEAESAQLSLKNPGPYVLLSVTDTGCGMEPEVLSRVFEPFYTTKAVGQGTGLGLSTVYGNVKQHGGTVLIDSKPGCGSKFEIYLPASTGRSSEVAQSPPVARRTTRGTETVLLAEDDEAIRKLGHTVLELEGYKVIDACDGREALDIYRNNDIRIDVLLFDIMMPNMNGQEAYDAIHAINPKVPAVFASGYSMNQLDPNVLSTNGVLFVQKPFRSWELLAAVRGVLDTRANTPEPSAT